MKAHTIPVVTIVVQQDTVKPGLAGSFDSTLEIGQDVCPRQELKANTGVGIAPTAVSIPGDQARLCDCSASHNNAFAAPGSFRYKLVEDRID